MAYHKLIDLDDVEAELASIRTRLDGPLDVSDRAARILGRVEVTNQVVFPTSLEISNFPAVQSITGTIDIGNFPATQTVAGTVGISNFPTSFDVGNFPASFNVGNFPTSFDITDRANRLLGLVDVEFPDVQAISGTVLVGNFPTEFGITSSPTRLLGRTIIDNFPVVQSISGSVSIANLPANQLVSGTVNIGNFPETQPVVGTVAISNYPSEIDIASDPSRRIGAVSMLNSDGTAITPASPLFVDVGADLSVTAGFSSVVSTVNRVPRNLIANEVWIGEWEDVRDYAGISAVVFTDQSSAVNGVQAQFADILDSGDPNATVPIRVITATVPANVSSYFEIPPEARYFRVRYVNGPVATGFIRTQIIYRSNPPGLAQLPVGAQTTDINVGGIVQGHMKARVYSGPTAGAWLPLGTDGTGALLTKDSGLAARDLATSAAQEGARVILSSMDDKLQTLVSSSAISTLTGRLLDKKPTDGYRLWLHDAAVTNAGVGTILAEAPAGSATSATAWRGILVPEAPGQFIERESFAWADRLVGW
jgi:hypothetical protein